ncbi:MAG: uncharacterized protein QOD13_3880 [Thermoleophilaceae bacterium]|jgi:carbon monoxide dehydrogenase subunit G|nr:uncharacterized protein [Thermoleophilaceae bacterium]
MEFTNEFTMDAPIADVWSALIDVESIAPCVPGFQLTSADGDEYRGELKVRVGAVVAAYRAVIRLKELDSDAYRAVMTAEGSELRGQGSVGATVTSSLTTTEDAGTKVSLVTELDVTGRVAQMGRGILEEVSKKQIRQFADCLEARFEADRAAHARGDSEAPRAFPPAEAKPVNVLGVGFMAVLRWLSPRRLVRALRRRQ